MPMQFVLGMMPLAQNEIKLPGFNTQMADWNKENLTEGINSD